MRSIAIKEGATLNGNFYEKDQIVGLSRFIKAAKHRINPETKKPYTYDEVVEAWDDAYGLKCERKRVHMMVIPAVFSTRGNRGYHCCLTLAERLKLATSAMDPHDIKLCYPAFLETAMEVYGLTMDSFGKEAAK